MYSKNEGLKETAGSLKVQKELAYTGLIIDVSGISHAEAMKIKALEGVLEATQKRLKAYIALHEASKTKEKR